MLYPSGLSLSLFLLNLFLQNQEYELIELTFGFVGMLESTRCIYKFDFKVWKIVLYINYYIS